MYLWRAGDANRNWPYIETRLWQTIILTEMEIK